MPVAPSQSALAELKSAAGPGGWLDALNDIEPYQADFRRLYRGSTPLVLQPADPQRVCAILAICNREEIAVVPHGGNTGYCGGATPDESGNQIVLSMRRLNRVRQLDPVNYSMTVEAGVTLAQAQKAAGEVDRLFPLSLGSEGSAQIGGNVSTNAGGTAVLRYGMMRDLVLGLEVVLADGRLLSGLKSLRKDNTGYDVKGLFIGAEGTLGIVTAVSLKLFPPAADAATALVALESPQHALDLLSALRGSVGDLLTTFELLPRRAVELTVTHVPGVANPLAQNAPWYVLIELTSPNPNENLANKMTGALQLAVENGMAADAIIAASISQSLAMWKLRESIPEAQRHHGASLKHDISVPVSTVPSFIAQGTALVHQMIPASEVIGYGHLGDGNLHFNVSPQDGMDPAAFLARGPALERAIFDLVDAFGGSISAEHGIGRLKRAEFAQRADPVELSVMQSLKHTLDPKGILNPGKVVG